MLASVLGTSAQQSLRPAIRSSALGADLLLGRGSLALGGAEPRPRLLRAGSPLSIEPLLVTVADELHVEDEPTVALMAPNINPAPSTLAASPATARPSRGSRELQRDVRPFLIAIRSLLDADQLIAARRLLSAAPAHIGSDPALVKLRFLLSPPVVKTAHRRDPDRTQEYAWLRAEAHKYRGRWVALLGDTLLASAPTLRDLRDILKSVPTASLPLLHRVD